MNKSIEPQPVLINLALAVADALEDPATPASLMDALSEIGSGLVDELSSEKIAPQLRALARIHTEAYPEIKTLNAGHLSAKANA
jgi:hypothetical protein